MCYETGLYDIKNLNGESLLNKKILALCNKKRLPKNQSQMLTNRYLTLNLLNEVPLEEYNQYKEALQTDIDLISKNTKVEELNSFKLITMKQASEIKKQYNKDEDFFQKLMDGKYDAIQNLSFDIVRFAFSRYYNNKPYLSDMTQKAQYGILQAGAVGLRIASCNFAADCLVHSLQEKPEDIIITKGDIIDEIIRNEAFKKEINKILKKYEKQEQFITGKEEESITFASVNLFFALHNTFIEVIGNKKIDGTWNLDITLDDEYDFTDLQEIEEYVDNDEYFKSLAGAIGNNLAMIANSCNVVNTYHITIKFSINSKEVELDRKSVV